jgi:hypothetical protein
MGAAAHSIAAVTAFTRNCAQSGQRDPSRIGSRGFMETEVETRKPRQRTTTSVITDTSMRMLEYAISLLALAAAIVIGIGR